VQDLAVKILECDSGKGGIWVKKTIFRRLDGSSGIPNSFKKPESLHPAGN
jgi:hypothetical protein